MPNVTIEEQGCRGCTMCVDICPVDVFSFDEPAFVAQVERANDCIGCLSCVYVCPSRCVEVSGVPLMRPFHRVEKNSQLIKKFLQGQTQQEATSVQDWEEAAKDVAARLSALGAAVTETMGRGQRVVGRKAGAMAAAHLPEMYEETSLHDVLARMQERFRHSFDFDFEVKPGEDGDEVEISFHPCGLNRVVSEQGQTLGDAVLCQLFHEYWSGLLGAFTQKRFRCAMKTVGPTCAMHLTQ